MEGALGATATLSQSPVLAGVRPFGKNLFDLYDFVSSNLLLPVGGLAIAVVGGWLIGREALVGELDRSHAGTHRAARVVSAFARWVTPVLILLILLSGLMGGGAASEPAPQARTPRDR